MAAGIKVNDVDEMRAQYARGESAQRLALQYGCCYQTVRRYCANIERERSKPLDTTRISELLRQWGPTEMHETKS